MYLFSFAAVYVIKIVNDFRVHVHKHSLGIQGEIRRFCCALAHFWIPSEQCLTLIGKNLLPMGTNCFLLEGKKSLLPTRTNDFF